MAVLLRNQLWSLRYRFRYRAWCPISVEHLEDAHPQYEPYSLGGNEWLYSAWWRLQNRKRNRNFTEKGKASWYGKKFHGHLTSNGEIYDMYSMSGSVPKHYLFRAMSKSLIPTTTKQRLCVLMIAAHSAKAESLTSAMRQLTSLMS